MVQELLEKNVKGHVKGSEFIIAVPTDITEVEKKAFYDLFFKSKMKPKSVFCVINRLRMQLDLVWM